MADVALTCGGKTYGGWTTLHLARSMEYCANGFDLGASELWPGLHLRYVINAGDACVVTLDGRQVISGWVDDVTLRLTASEHAVSVRGRDAAGDLVDCAAVVKGGQWSGLRVEQIAQRLAAPFGLRVRAAINTGKPLASFAIQEGESVFDAVDRAARMRALLVLSDGNGGIVITRASTDRVGTALVMGRNVLTAEVKMSMAQRFSRYIAKGQNGGSVYDLTEPGQAARHNARIKAEAVDPEVTRYRPMVLTGECQDVAASLQDRVRWEANVRAARSLEVTVRVQGWTHANGLWEPNKLVDVSLPQLRVTGTLLLKACAYTLGPEGMQTELTLTRADAYTLLPLKPKGSGMNLELDTSPAARK